MPEWPKEAQAGKTRTMHERHVSLYSEGNGKLWTNKEDSEWLVRSFYIQQQVKGVAAIASDDEGPDAHEIIEADMTPEKLPQPQQGEGHVHERRATTP